MTSRDWFRSAFGAHYLAVYSHRNEAEARHTVDLIVRVGNLSPGAMVLDAPCGAGRHAREFRRRGFHVAAVDLSPQLLAEATGADADEPGVSYVRSDIRHLPFRAESFDVVANLFSSFGYFLTDAENLLALRELTKACRVDGIIVVDTMNAPFVRRSLQPFSERRTSDGWVVQEWRRIAGALPRVEKRVRVQPCHGEAGETHESVRLYEPCEIEDALVVCGSRITHRFGSYEGSGWTPDSDRLILVGRRER